MISVNIGTSVYAKTPKFRDYRKLQEIMIGVDRDYNIVMGRDIVISALWWMVWIVFETKRIRLME